MNAQILSASEAEGRRPPVIPPDEFPVRTTNRDPGVQAWRDDAGTPVTLPKLFRFTLLSKNAPANHLVSHSCKNKGLKVPCFHPLTKKRVGEGSRISCFDLRVSSPNFRLSAVACQLSRVSPLSSALTSKRASKSFRCNTYEKHTGGRGGTCAQQPYFRLSTAACQLTSHQSLVTSHATEVS